MIRRALATTAALILLVQVALSGVLMPCVATGAEAIPVAHQNEHGAHHSAPAGDTPGDPVHCVAAAPCVAVMAAEAAPGAWAAPMASAAAAAEPSRLASVSRTPELPPPRA